MARVIEEVKEYAVQPPCKTATEMEEICCENVGELPCCKKVSPEWNGYTDEEILEKLGIELDENGLDNQGREVRIERTPRTQPCGEMVTEYDLDPSNCCDEIPPLLIDEEATPDILPAGESITVYFSGGQAPFTLVLTNHDTYFQSGQRMFITDSRSVRIHANGDFCGATAFKVTDACTSAISLIRSNQGQWVPRGEKCMFSGATGTQVSGRTSEYVSGKYKQVEEVERATWKGPCMNCFETVQDDSNEPECIGEPCVRKFIKYIKQDRPEASWDTTCLTHDIDLLFGDYITDLYGTDVDGALLGQFSGGGCSFHCDWGGSVASGATGEKGGVYANQTSIGLYEWVC